MAINTPEQWEEVTEKVESIYTKENFLRRFIQTRLKNKDWRKKVDFINEVMDTSLSNEDTIPRWIIAELEKYLQLNSEFRHKWKINKNDLESFKVWELRKHINSAFLWLNNNRNRLKTNILKEYEIDEKTYNKELEKKVESLNENELNSLIWDINQRSKFIKEAFTDKKWEVKMPKRREMLELFSQLNLEPKITKKLEKLEWEERNNFVLMIKNFQSLNVDRHDIEELFAMDLLTEYQKREIIFAFMPSISIDEAKALWLIDDNKALEIIEDLSKKYYKEQCPEQSKFIDYELLAKTVDTSEIIIPTESVVISDDNLKNLYTNLSLQPIADAISTVSSETEEKIIWKWPKSFEELKEKIKKEEDALIKFEDKERNLERFTPWNVLRLKIVDASWKESYIFSKIWAIDLWQDKDSFLLYESWEWDTYLKWAKAHSIKNYWFFLEFLKNEKKLLSIDIFTEEEISRNPSIKEKDVSWNIKLKTEKELDKEQEDLMEQVENKKKELVKEGIYDDVRWEEIEEESEIARLKHEIDYLKEYNVNELLKAINEIDRDWERFWLEQWTTFWIKETGEKKVWTNVWTVQSIDNNQIIIRWLWKDETIPLQTFYESWKEKEATRVAKVNWIWDLFQSFSSNWNISTERAKYEIKSGKIKMKKTDWIELDSSDKKPVEYLECKDDNKYLKVYNIWEDSAEISFWEIIEKWKWKDKKSTRKECEKQKISLWALASYINDYSLTPWKVDWKIDKIQEVERHWSFFSKLFQNKSLAELLQWGKLVVDSIEKLLTEWRDDHAAKVAYGLFWKFLPYEIRMDLKSREQEAEKKRQEDAMTRLKSLDSSEATVLIERWLLNKNCPQNKLEAAAVFMYENYWSLYAKTLEKYQWTFLWYKAFWWNPNDRLYREIKWKARNPVQWVNFTEEELLYILIKKQCSENSYREYWWILRRSRFHKDIKGKWPNWIQEEIKKWYWDAEDTRSVEWMNEWFYWELTGWTPANSLWWIKKIWERWEWLKNTFEAITALLVSWAIYWMDQRMISKEVKDWHKWKWAPLTFIDFIDTPQNADLFNETFLEVCKSLSEKSWKSEPAETAQYFFDNKEEWWIDFNDPKRSKLRVRLEKFQNFWDEHWSQILPALLMLNWWTWENSKNNKLLHLEKKEKPVFERYIERMDFLGLNWLDFTNDYFKIDWAKWVWLTWISTSDAVRQVFEVWSSEQMRQPELMQSLWYELLWEANRVLKWDFTKEEKELQLELLFRDVIKWIYARNSEKSITSLFKIKHPWSFLIEKLWLIGLDQRNYFSWLSIEDLNWWWNNANKATNWIKILVSDFIASWWDVQANGWWALDDFMWEVSKSTDKTLNKSDDNLDDNY